MHEDYPTSEAHYYDAMMRAERESDGYYDDYAF